MSEDGAGTETEKALWRRVPEDPRLVAGHYADLAAELAKVVNRLGSFDRALSTLPVFLFAFGVAVFSTGIILRLYVPHFGSSEFNDMTLFAIVFVVASAATYIAEIRIRDAAERDKQAVEAARAALANLSQAEHTPALSSGDNQNRWRWLSRTRGS
jgi:hypothetical protein